MAAPRIRGVRWGIGVLLGAGVLVNYFDRINLSVGAPQLQQEFCLTLQRVLPVLRAVADPDRHDPRSLRRHKGLSGQRLSLVAHYLAATASASRVSRRPAKWRLAGDST
jgi:hypothetical protein